jgi:hypothetical protein
VITGETIHGDVNEQGSGTNQGSRSRKRFTPEVSTLSLKVVRELRGVPGRDRGFCRDEKASLHKRSIVNSNYSLHRRTWVEEQRRAAEAAVTDQLDVERVGESRRTRRFLHDVLAKWAHVQR